MRSFFSLIVLLLVGCPGRSFQQQRPTDAGVSDGAFDAGPIDAGGHDAGPVDGGEQDAGPRGGGSCEPANWLLETRPLDSVTALFPVPSRVGTTEQLDVVVRLASGCERLAYLEDVGYSGNATDFVGLIAHVWTPGACDSATPMLVHRTWRVTEWGNLRVVVADRSGAETGPVFTYGREVCSGTDCACSPGSTRGTGAEGATCQTDCSCAEGLSCLCADGVATSEPCACQRPCDDFLDCAAGERCQGGPVHACNAGGSCANASCPPGFACVSESCVDQRDASQPLCGCDAECGAGELCAPVGEVRRCVIPCWRDVDCPPNRGLACIESLCRLLE